MCPSRTPPGTGRPLGDDERLGPAAIGFLDGQSVEETFPVILRLFYKKLWFFELCLWGQAGGCL